MSQASPDAEGIERELAELGEPPPSAAELALAARPEALDAEPELACVARLSKLAEPLTFDDLSELERHRGWREVERRLDDRAPEAAKLERGGGVARRWPYLAAGLAVAAAVLLVVLQPDAELADPGPSASEVAALGDTVRASLRALGDGETDTQRAASVVEQYQRRLEEQGG